jgi:hypothetical protein
LFNEEQDAGWRRMEMSCETTFAHMLPKPKQQVLSGYIPQAEALL